MKHEYARATVLGKGGTSCCTILLPPSLNTGSVIQRDSALLKIFNDMFEAVDLEWTRFLVALDLFGAFDTFDYSILLRALSK